MLAGTRRFLTRQRIPVGRLPIRRPGPETAWFLAYALLFVGLSWITGQVIKHHPRPILGASYFTSDVFYIVFLKLLGLLAVPLALAAGLGYRLRDIFAGDRLDRRGTLGMAAALLVGASLNQGDLHLIAAAAPAFATPALVGRVALGIALPLVSAAIPEEIFFRGLLQSRLERVAGRLVGVLGTALLFAAWHLPSRYLLASGLEGQAGDFTSILLGTGLPVFVVGLIFGRLYDRYRRLLPLIAAHGGIDAVSSVAAMLRVAM